MHYSLLEKIFSIKEGYGHKFKIITILGLHINIKRKFFWKGKYRPFLTPTHLNDKYIYQNGNGNDPILRTLQQNKPCMITRFGANELDTVSQFYETIDDMQTKFEDWNIKSMKTNAGFFSADNEQLTRYSCEIVQMLHNIDILGVWNYDRSVKYFKRSMHLITDNCTNTQLVTLGELSKFGMNDNIWTQYLENKKVLVIHPFEATIKSQYEKRKLLFNDSKTLPDFELKTIKAVQSIGKDSIEFKDWFEALESMYRQIDSTDFDIALIGAGAYGMHLANYIKNKGKQAVHIGGNLQILFGIKGARWENSETTKLFNEHWTFPLPEDTPKSLNEFKKCEGNAAYW